ncbi:MAG: hypothetical protein P8Y38_00575 [Deltaproteobacteria bacterium]
MRRFTLVIVVTIFSVVFEVSIGTITDQYDFGWGYGLGMYPRLDPFAKIFDAESIREISGEVIKVERVIPGVESLAPVQIKITVLVDRREPVPVYLGPSWYVAGREGRIPFKSGDEVTVTGSWITSQKKPFMIALQVSKGGSAFRLRHKDGMPIWSGWKSGQK